MNQLTAKTNQSSPANTNCENSQTS